MNTLKTTFLMALMTVLLVIIGRLIGGNGGMLFAFIIAAVMNFIGYWSSDKIALMRYHAQPVSREQAPELHRMVDELSQRADLPSPRVYIIPSQTPNAFATGRNAEHAAVAVTEGALSLLTRDELKGVLGHELAHIKNKDILIQSVAATLAGAITMLATWARFAAIFGGARTDRRDGGLELLAMAIVAPIAALLIQMGLSRSREFAADATGAKINGAARPLASALNKLDDWAARKPLNASSTTAHMFIVNPLRGGGLAGLFRTHPSTEERVKRLLSME